MELGQPMSTKKSNGKHGDADESKRGSSKGHSIKGHKMLIGLENAVGFTLRTRGP